MGSTHKIRKEKTENGTWIYILDIYSNEIVRDIQTLEKNWGEYLSNPHFLRGLIDGDGMVSIQQGRLRVCLCGANIEFLKATQKVWGGKIYFQAGKVWQLLWEGRDAEKICNMIYGVTMPFLCIARKFSRWQLYQAMKELSLSNLSSEDNNH
jgi:hypothetical protein